MSRLISDSYQKLNHELHRAEPGYGAGGHKNVDLIVSFLNAIGATTLLDYGCGKGSLKLALEKKMPALKVREYDPAIPEKSAQPEPAQIVTCLDVMEHIEPDFLEVVLVHIHSVTTHAVLMTISTTSAEKILADGRNAHLIIKGHRWWREKINLFFEIIHEEIAGTEGFLIAGHPRPAADIPGGSDALFL